jgi:hypothetical protein
VNFVRYTWGTRHEPGGSYVIEREAERTDCAVFGPMPAELVTKFLAERQDLARSIINRELNYGLARNLPGDPARP